MSDYSTFITNLTLTELIANNYLSIDDNDNDFQHDLNCLSKMPNNEVKTFCADEEHTSKIIGIDRSKKRPEISSYFRQRYIKLTQKEEEGVKKYFQ